jgi:hypothetical protein
MGNAWTGWLAYKWTATDRRGETEERRLAHLLLCV